VPIAARAGAVVTDRIGAPIRFNAAPAQAAGVVAAAPGLHGALMGGWCHRWSSPRQAGGLHPAVILATIRPLCLWN